MTWEERMYMRAIMARDPVWAKAFAQEMAVAPRDPMEPGRFVFYWDAEGRQQCKREEEWEVERLCESLQKAWRETQWP